MELNIGIDSEQRKNIAGGLSKLLAERIRALGIKAPGSYSAFAALTAINEGTGEESAEEMIRELVRGQETVVRTAREACWPDQTRHQRGK